MIIYKITNTINNKAYIGQTKYDFKKRYNNTIRWWVYTGNCALKQSSKKYGHENFKIEILKDNIKNLKELNKLEIFYIKKYKTLHPDGYNFCIGGDNREYTDLIKDKMSFIKRNGIPYKFKNPNGKIIEVLNLSKFCRENNLNISKMSNVANKSRNHHNGWTLPETILKEPIIYEFLSPDNKYFIFKGKELPEFCRKNNLSYTGMWSLYKGRSKSYHKWEKFIKNT